MKIEKTLVELVQNVVTYSATNIPTTSINSCAATRHGTEFLAAPSCSTNFQFVDSAQLSILNTTNQTVLNDKRFLKNR